MPGTSDSWSPLGFTLTCAVSFPDCWSQGSDANKFLDMNGHLAQTLDPRSELAQRVLDNAVIKAGNNYVVPAVADAPQRDIKHRDDLPSERLVAVERDGAEELLTFRVAGIVRAGVRLQ